MLWGHETFILKDLSKVDTAVQSLNYADFEAQYSTSRHHEPRNTAAAALKEASE